MGNDFNSNSYKKAVEQARKNGIAGTKYHILDKQFKKWKSKICIPKKISSPPLKKEIIGRSNIVETKKEQREKLYEKYKKEQREKFVETLTTHCCCDHLKGVGNGL